MLNLKFCGALLYCVLAVAAAPELGAQRLERMVNRERIITGPVATVWESIVNVLAAADVRIEAIDSCSHLISLTFSIPGTELQTVVLEEAPRQEMVAQMVV